MTVTETRTCVDCGLPLVANPRGRKPTRCGECNRGRRRVKERPDCVCVDCGVTFKPANHTGKPPSRCTPCAEIRKREVDREKAARWREANPDRHQENSRRNHEKRKADPGYRQYHRDRHLLKYGVTRAELDVMLEAQGHRCAVCGGERNGPGSRLHIDHCHDTNRVRGLLCSKCNTAVGLLDNDPERAEAVAAYLRR